MAQPSNGPWRLLILDSTPDDPMWIIATITLPTDVRPAAIDRGSGRYLDWDAAVSWVRDQVTGAGPVSLVPISAVAWRVDESEPR